MGCPHVHTLINNVSQNFNLGQNLKAKEVLQYKAYPDRKNACVDKNRSLAFRCIWMLFYSFIMKCRSTNNIPNKDELYNHITDAINMCTKYHPNSELTIAFRKYGHASEQWIVPSQLNLSFMSPPEKKFHES